MAVFLSFLFFFSTLILQSLAQSFVLWNITGDVPGLNSSCISVLNQAISCDPAVRTIDRRRFESNATLNSLCTSTCANSWSTYLRRVQGACGSSRYTAKDGYQYLPLLRAESVYEQFQGLCLKNSAGNFCNAVIRDTLKIDSNLQATSSGSSPPASTYSCGDCFLSTMAQYVQQPLSAGPEYNSMLSSLQSQCKTTLSISVPSKTTWSIPPTSTTPTGCDGTVYTVKSSDTCQSIALSQGFSTTKLLTANKLPAYCRKFPAAGSTICLPNAAKCWPYALKSGDTCQTIASSAKASFAQIVSWNPELGPFCGNINHLINKTAIVCASTPGGAWVNPSPAPTTTTSSTTDPVFGTSGTPMASFGTIPPKQTTGPNAGYVTPFANNTRLDCATYVNPPVLVNATWRVFSYSCSAVARAYGISVNDLLAWNPSINATGGAFDPCELSPTKQYCVQPLANVSTGITGNCTLKTIAPPGLDCPTFAVRNNITKAALIAWNPALGTNCTNYAQGTTYCKAVSHFRSPDTISNCAYWAMANSSTTAICQQMVDQYKLTMPRFMAWNPSVQSDCSGAVKGFDYCVGTPTVHPGFP